MARAFSLLAVLALTAAFTAVPAGAQGPVDSEDEEEVWPAPEEVGEDESALSGRDEDDLAPAEDAEEDAWRVPVPEGDGTDRTSWPVPSFEPAPYEPEIPSIPTTSMVVVPGRRAKLRPDGTAAIPRGAPRRVRDLIRAANRIAGRPYRWGGGHARVEDRGYDCSGAVSYALIRVGLLRGPLVSGSLARRYSAGAGRHVTIYANTGHVYMEIAGLRFDTSSVGERAGRQGVRWRVAIGRRPGFRARHPVGL